jgi:hypothetical protein
MTENILNLEEYNIRLTEVYFKLKVYKLFINEYIILKAESYIFLDEDIFLKT